MKRNEFWPEPKKTCVICDKEVNPETDLFVKQSGRYGHTIWIHKKCWPKKIEKHVHESSLKEGLRT